MKHLISSLAFSLLVGSFAAHADLPDLPVDGRIRILTYAPADVYTVPTKYGYQTSIVFASNEEITTVSVGDRSMWQIIPSGNRIFIRPMDDGLTTNMTVITNMREYNFDILSVEGEHSNNLYVVQFRYPDKRASTIADTLNDGEMPMTPPARFTPMAAPAPVASHVVIAPLDTQRTQTANEAYTYSGDDSVAPLRVYDDGKKTYVQYQTMPSPAPVPMVATSGGYAVANHSIDGNLMIVHTVVSGFKLVSPAGEVTVYNEYSTPKVE